MSKERPKQASAALGTGEWGPCEAGELSALRGQLRSDAFRRQLPALTAGGAALVLLMALVGTSLFLSESSARPEFIACRECVELMPSYHANRLAQTELTASSLAVEQHLSLCRQCRERYATNFAELVPAAAAVGFLGLFFRRSLLPWRVRG